MTISSRVRRLLEAVAIVSCFCASLSFAAAVAEGTSGCGSVTPRDAQTALAGVLKVNADVCKQIAPDASADPTWVTLTCNLPDRKSAVTIQMPMMSWALAAQPPDAAGK